MPPVTASRAFDIDPTPLIESGSLGRPLVAPLDVVHVEERQTGRLKLLGNFEDAWHPACLA
jgi:hypothetical protein